MSNSNNLPAACYRRQAVDSSFEGDDAFYQHYLNTGVLITPASLLSYLLSDVGQSVSNELCAMTCPMAVIEAIRKKREDIDGEIADINKRVEQKIKEKKEHTAIYNQQADIVENPQKHTTFFYRLFHSDSFNEYIKNSARYRDERAEKIKEVEAEIKKLKDQSVRLANQQHSSVGWIIESVMLQVQAAIMQEYPVIEYITKKMHRDIINYYCDDNHENPGILNKFIKSQAYFLLSSLSSVSVVPSDAHPIRTFIDAVYPIKRIDVITRSAILNRLGGLNITNALEYDF